MSAIAISYRRQDTRWAAGRIRDHLALAFGSDAVFEDVVSIPLGVDFRTHINAVIAQARVVLVLIGRDWLDSKLDSGERRLTIESDHVRVEVESALASSARVIPVLIDDAPMPSSAELPKSLEQLAFLNGIRVRPDPDFKNDLGALIAAIRGAMEGVPRPSREDRLAEVQPDAQSRVKTIERGRWEGPAALFHLHGPHRGRVDALADGDVEREGLTIGRSDKAELVFDSDSISRLHARVTSRGIIDLGSTNGTMVNDVEISWAQRLIPGDVIRIGRVLLEFVSGPTYSDRLVQLKRELAETDGLTGLANASALTFFIREQQGALALVALRVEKLQELIDSSGAIGGDFALRKVAEALRPVMPSPHCLARLDGGRFCVAVPGLKSLEGARALGTRARKAVDDLVIDYDGKELRVTLAVGAITRASGPHEPSELINEAGTRASTGAPTGTYRAMAGDEDTTVPMPPLAEE